LHQDLISEVLKSGYDLDSNYESEKISNFKLPEVHREIGPIPLKRAIKVLLGPAWDLQVDEIPSNLTFQPFGKIFPSASAKNSLSIDTAITSSKTSGFITPFNKVLMSLKKLVILSYQKFIEKLDQYHLKEQLKSY
jgi:hypothetical protein